MVEPEAIHGLFQIETLVVPCTGLMLFILILCMDDFLKNSGFLLCHASPSGRRLE